MFKRTVWVLALLLVFNCLVPAQAEENVQFLMNAAAQKASIGHFRAAERRYRAVLQQDPTQIQAMFGLATALKAQARNKEAITVLESLIAQQPDFQPAYYLLGMIYEGQGDMIRAKQAYHTYVAVAPTNIPPDPEIRIKLRGFGVF